MIDDGLSAIKEPDRCGGRENFERVSTGEGREKTREKWKNSLGTRARDAPADFICCTSALRSLRSEFVSLRLIRNYYFFSPGFDEHSHYYYYYYYFRYLRSPKTRKSVPVVETKTDFVCCRYWRTFKLWPVRCHGKVSRCLPRLFLNSEIYNNSASTRAALGLVEINLSRHVCFVDVFCLI